MMVNTTDTLAELESEDGGSTGGGATLGEAMAIASGVGGAGGMPRVGAEGTAFSVTVRTSPRLTPRPLAMA